MPMHPGEGRAEADEHFDVVSRRGGDTLTRLQRPAVGQRRDYHAVRASLTLRHSSGRVEATANKIKRSSGRWVDAVGYPTRGDRGRAFATARARAMQAACPGPRISRSSTAEDYDVTTAPLHALPAAKRRRLIIIGLLRASAVTAALVVAYYLLPLDHLAGVPLGVFLAAGLLALTAMTAYQVRAIIRARYPGIRAIEALAATAPLFLLLFATTYVLMAQADLGDFNVHPLTRTDSLYFTVTVFATVGFGDITATSQTGRLIVTAQMILDLIVLGLGIRVFLGAVQRGQQQDAAQQEAKSR
jgi:voltage-gated potassium channel